MNIGNIGNWKVIGSTGRKWGMNSPKCVLDFCNQNTDKRLCKDGKKLRDLPSSESVKGERALDKNENEETGL